MHLWRASRRGDAVSSLHYEARLSLQTSDCTRHANWQPTENTSLYWDSTSQLNFNNSHELKETFSIARVTANL
jgi:hypothetical protein